MTSDWTTALSAIASALSAAFAAVAAFQVRKQIQGSDRAAEATVFLDIFSAWNAIYPAYRKLLSEPFDVEAAVTANPDFDRYAASPQWLEMRPVFAFFEFLGTLIRQNAVSEATVFSLVAVNVALWEKYAPLIEHFRQSSNRPDLYVGWEYLIERKTLRPAGREHLPVERANVFTRIFGGQG